MSLLLSEVIAWLINGFIASGVFWVFYCVLRSSYFSAATRYLYLKTSFLLIPIFPFIEKIVPTTFLSTVNTALSESAVRGVESSISLHTFAHPFVRTLSHSQSYLVGLLVCLLILIYFLFFLIRILKIIQSKLQIDQICRAAVPETITGFSHLVYIHEKELPPSIVGIFRPKILIPRRVLQEMNKDSLRMILLHEETHLKRRDHLWNWARVLISALFWFSPFIRILAKKFEEDMELSCDEILFQIPKFSRKEYGNLLLRLQYHPSFPTTADCAGVFMSNSLVSRRIHAMKNKTVRNKPLLAVSLILLSVISTGYCLAAFSADSKVDQLIRASIDSNKDFNLVLKASIVSDVTKESLKSQVALNADESASMQLGGIEVRVTPVSQSNIEQVTVELLDKKTGDVLRKSIFPLKSHAGLSVNLTQPLKQKIAVKIVRL